ncbi:hypothetical protein ACJX0J_008785, partial [Zea mays]
PHVRTTRVNNARVNATTRDDTRHCAKQRADDMGNNAHDSIGVLYAVCAGDASGGVGVGGLYEIMYNNVVSLCVKAIGWRLEWRFKSAHFPMVLVQMPMYNELE